MRYWYDTEFIESGYAPIHLLSIGIVAEDGREYYAAVRGAPLASAGDWVKANVIPYLGGPVKARREIAQDIYRFCSADGRPPELWGYFPHYDHVIFCQLFGTMMDLPPGWPQLTLDVMQEYIRAGRRDLPEHTGQEHNALDDARWTRAAWERIAAVPA